MWAHGSRYPGCKDGRMVLGSSSSSGADEAVLARPMADSAASLYSEWSSGTFLLPSSSSSSWVCEVKRVFFMLDSRSEKVSSTELDMLLKVVWAPLEMWVIVL